MILNFNFYLFFPTTGNSWCGSLVLFGLWGVDENHQVPALVGEGAELAIQDAAQARLNA